MCGLLIEYVTEEFRSAHPDERENLVMLENLMAEQIPLLGQTFKGIVPRDEYFCEGLKN
jgi:hypothetical protein